MSECCRWESLRILMVVGLATSALRADCPCTLWNDTFLPALPAVSDGQPIETGVRFRSDVNGYVTGLRFYKGAANIGTHVGHLWTNGGVLIEEATFSNESSSGWQTLTLPSPVAITANTTYVASYHSSAFYADTLSYFT